MLTHLAVPMNPVALGEIHIILDGRIGIKNPKPAAEWARGSDLGIHVPQRNPQLYYILRLSMYILWDNSLDL